MKQRKLRALAREIAVEDRRNRGTAEELRAAARAVVPAKMIEEEAARLEAEFQEELAAIGHGERRGGFGVNAATAILREAYSRKVTEHFVGEKNPWLR